MADSPDSLGVQGYVEGVFYRGPVDHSKLAELARTIGHNLSSLSQLELARIRALIARRRDSSDLPDYEKGFLQAINELAMAFSVTAEKTEYDKNLARITRGCCQIGEIVLKRAVNGMTGRTIPTGLFEKHARGCKPCKKVSGVLNDRLKRSKL